MHITRGLVEELEASPPVPEDGPDPQDTPDLTDRRARRVAAHWLASRLVWEQNLDALRRATGMEGAGAPLRRSA